MQASCSTPNGVLYAGGENETGISDKTFLLKWDAGKIGRAIETLAALPVAVTNASATSHNSIVFIAGGESRDGVFDKCWSIDLSNSAYLAGKITLIAKPVSHAVFVSIKSADSLKLYLVGGRRKLRRALANFIILYLN